MEKRPTIALLTDFGNQDSYVAEVKAVILSINSNVNIIDITHRIEPQNILHGALMLKRSVAFFPRHTIFVCVVDPEVGSERKIIYIDAQDYCFIAPDNGLLWMTVNDQDVRKVITLANYNYFLSRIPSTFEGRDKMAPVAAYASLGIESTQFGPTQSGIEKLEMPEPLRERDLLVGEIIYFDYFGNAITNISFENLMENEAVSLPRVVHNSNEIGPIVSTFSEAVNGSPLAYFGSSGYLELAVNNGNFQRAMNAGPGDKVLVNYGK
jgi:S-adenosylmethionine hydrolase